MRIKVILQCTECMARNYTIEKQKGDTKRFEIKKFCPTCGRHTLHRETR